VWSSASCDDLAQPENDLVDDVDGVVARYGCGGRFGERVG